MKINATNERVKHRYFDYLREARQLGSHSVDQAAKALDRFEEFTKRRSFREFRTEQAVAFKHRLSTQTAQRSGERLSKATIASTLNALREFFEWLSGQRGYRSKIAFSDAAYFKPSRADEAIARARRPSPVPTIDQIRQMLAGSNNPGFPILSENGLETEHVQRLLDDHADLGSVINDKNFLHSCGNNSKQETGRVTNDS